MTNARGVPTPLTPPGGIQRFGRRILDDPAHDPYRASGNWAAGTQCSGCGAQFMHGHWAWQKNPAPAASSKHLCPACQRVHDHQPAGYLTLDGPTLSTHRDEILALARHEAARASADHPLQRVMDIIEHEDRVEITTTDIHVPPRIGQALHRAHHGELAISYGHDEISVRVHWTG